MLLLVKPKRTNSNFTLEDFSKAKLLCRTSFEQYKNKFHYEPDWNSFHQQTKIHPYEKKKKSEAQKIVSSAHSYSVQSHRNINALNKQTSVYSSRKQRPSTAKTLVRKAPKPKEETQTSKNLSELFQNQHLSSTLQITESHSIKNQTSQSQHVAWRLSSESFNRTSICSKKFIFKTKITDVNDETNRSKQNISRQENSQSITSILAKKQNFYNPYHIGPSLLKIKSIKPVKTLRNQSIRQLKQLCQEERNMNFTQKIQSKENHSTSKILKKIEEKQEGTKSVPKNPRRNITQNQDILKSSKIKEAKLEKKMRNRIFSKVRDFKKAQETNNSYFPVDKFGKFIK